ncbi:hypothetical protein LTR95_008335 [Oleoguttula sp. CCFEE 5521]
MPFIQPQHHPQQQMPQRLSALYQFHNAPEVAPAHGLEYDDTPYPSSDKYPVIHTAASSSYDTKYTGKHAYNDNRPPRIIFGMKIKTFLVVAFVVMLIVVGAAVGGAVGGKALRQNNGGDGMWPEGTISNATSTTAASPTSATPTFTAAIPTYTPLSDCPDSNNTTYTSAHYNTVASTPNSTPPLYLTFTKHCALASPLSASGSTTLSDAFVYSFSDCVELCASFNVVSQKADCSVAVYRPGGNRPGNCWVGKASFDIGSLAADEGTDVAVVLGGSKS